MLFKKISTIKKEKYVFKVRNMDKVDALNILKLPLNTSVDEIKVRFRELAQEHHSDHGGDDEKMKLYLEAYRAARDKNNAIENNGNKLVTFNDFNKTLTSKITSLEKVVRRANSYNNLKEQIIRDCTRTYKTDKRFAFYTGSISALIFFAWDRMDQIFDPSNLSNSSVSVSHLPLIKNVFLFFGIFFGLEYIFFTVKITKVENAVEDITDTFESKNEYWSLLQELLPVYCGTFNVDKFETFDETDLITIIRNWTKNTDLAKLQRACRVIGDIYFARIFISKGLELGMLKEHEKIIKRKYVVRYSVCIEEELKASEVF